MNKLLPGFLFSLVALTGCCATEASDPVEDEDDEVCVEEPALAKGRTRIIRVAVGTTSFVDVICEDDHGFMYSIYLMGFKPHEKLGLALAPSKDIREGKIPDPREVEMDGEGNYSGLFFVKKPEGSVYSMQSVACVSSHGEVYFEFPGGLVCK